MELIPLYKGKGKEMDLSGVHRVIKNMTRKKCFSFNFSMKMARFMVAQ